MQSSPAPTSCDAQSLWFTTVWFRRVTWWEKRGSCWGRQTEGSVLGLRNTAAAQLKFTDAATATGPVLQALISLRVTAQQSVFFAFRPISPLPTSLLWNGVLTPTGWGSHVSWLCLAPMIEAFEDGGWGERERPRYFCLCLSALQYEGLLWLKYLCKDLSFCKTGPPMEILAFTGWS